MKLEQQWSTRMKLEQQLLINFMKLEQQLLINGEWS